MILFIIIAVRDKTDVVLETGKQLGVLLPGTLVALMAMNDLSFLQWRGVVVLCLLATSLMLFHKRLRHFVLLPLCIAFASGDNIDRKPLWRAVRMTEMTKSA